MSYIQSLVWSVNDETKAKYPTGNEGLYSVVNSCGCQKMEFYKLFSHLLYKSFFNSVLLLYSTKLYLQVLFTFL